MLTSAVVACGVLLSGGTALTLTTTTTFTVTMTISTTCVINSATALGFGTTSFIAANVDQTSSIQVQCTNTTPYNIGLDAGVNGGTTTTRLMKSGSNTIQYTLWQNAGRTTNWGNTVGTDTQSATGNGAGQNFTVYGRVPPQTPVPGSYSDTITVTVTY